jgi:hypothetical protein
MLKLFIVGIYKSEGGLWAKSNSKVLDFSPSTERRDFRRGVDFGSKRSVSFLQMAYVRTSGKKVNWKKNPIKID